MQVAAGYEMPVVVAISNTRNYKLEVIHIRECVLNMKANLICNRVSVW
jgi:hypothetical protein